jgi:hypothetical protein
LPIPSNIWQSCISTCLNFCKWRGCHVRPLLIYLYSLLCAPAVSFFFFFIFSPVYPFPLMGSHFLEVCFFGRIHHSFKQKAIDNSWGKKQTREQLASTASYANCHASNILGFLVLRAWSLASTHL